MALKFSHEPLLQNPFYHVGQKYIHREGHVLGAEPSRSSSKRPEKLQPATDGSRCRISLPNIRWSSGSPAEEREEGLEKPEQTGIPCEHGP